MRGGGVVEERTMVHDELNDACQGSGTAQCVVDQYAEQDDGVLHFFTEWPVVCGRAG